jgi:hypothetical protein
MSSDMRLVLSSSLLKRSGRFFANITVLYIMPDTRHINYYMDSKNNYGTASYIFIAFLAYLRFQIWRYRKEINFLKILIHIIHIIHRDMHICSCNCTIPLVPTYIILFIIIPYDLC